MIELLYDSIKDRKETETVMDFLTRFVNNDDDEELFLAAVRDTRLAGFKEGVKAVLELMREIS